MTFIPRAKPLHWVLPLWDSKKRKPKVSNLQKVNSCHVFWLLVSLHLHTFVLYKTHSRYPLTWFPSWGMHFLDLRSNILDDPAACCDEDHLKNHYYAQCRTPSDSFILFIYPPSHFSLHYRFSWGGGLTQIHVLGTKQKHRWGKLKPFLLSLTTWSKTSRISLLVLSLHLSCNILPSPTTQFISGHHPAVLHDHTTLPLNLALPSRVKIEVFLQPMNKALWRHTDYLFTPSHLSNHCLDLCFMYHSHLEFLAIFLKCMLSMPFAQFTLLGVF